MTESKTTRYATLEGHTVVPVDDAMTWAKWYEEADRVVAKDTIAGGVAISTIFLGLDRSFGHGPPLWFETRIFGGEHGGYQVRYTTWDLAEAGHREVIGIAKGTENAEQ